MTILTITKIKIKNPSRRGEERTSRRKGTGPCGPPRLWGLQLLAAIVFAEDPRIRIVLIVSEKKFEGECEDQGSGVGGKD